MNYREKMKEYLKEPDEYSNQYGKWAILNREQRNLIKRLLREMDGADEVIKHQYFEIERLNNIINEFESWLIGWIENEQYCFMSNNPKDRCRGEVYEEVLHHFKELKGDESNE